MGFAQGQHLPDHMLLDTAVAPLVNFFIHLGKLVGQGGHARREIHRAAVIRVYQAEIPKLIALV